MNKSELEFQNIHKNHRKRVKDKFLQSGLSNFAEHEILELLLFYSIPQADTNPTAHRLINTFGSLAGVMEASYENLLSVKGVGEQSATLIKLLPAIMSEFNKHQLQRAVINNQRDAMQYLMNIYKGVAVEQFYVICINAKNEVICVKQMNTGTASKVDVKIRSITELCLKQNCDRIIISHNHPQSDAQPSVDDITMTERIFNSSVLNEIDIIDHIIVSPTSCYSFAETGVMNQIKHEIIELTKYNISKEAYQRMSSSTANYVIK